MLRLKAEQTANVGPVHAGHELEFIPNRVDELPYISMAIHPLMPGDECAYHTPIPKHWLKYTMLKVLCTQNKHTAEQLCLVTPALYINALLMLPPPPRVCCHTLTKTGYLRPQELDTGVNSLFNVLHSNFQVSCGLVLNVQSEHLRPRNQEIVLRLKAF